MGIKIRIANLQDVERILTISHQVLGKDYLTFGSLQETNKQFLVAEKSEQIIGFTGLHFVSFAYLRYLLEKYPIQLPDFDDEMLICKMNTLAVLPEFQQRGIGKQLHLARLELAQNLGYKHFFLMAWKHPQQGIQAEKLLLQTHFEKIIELPNFWYQESLLQQYECAACGNPCLCTAALFLRGFSG
jgi:N-acetylglutamate synthase-like GNAT family acetyltransferase